ncbi:hypothetical protein A3A84_01050 [Candidatus Collierbacteria bacterium RIFCSPLOWO2_01_FULL_50_23]|uniref:Uncharacterized protein n=2 Tax=Candidatus Collieribacteriota TaxID=1752725 RepID=A0A1F5EQS5_9BACT|nr:MAG: hypothetical protein A3D09_01800 [Candidatus Collierbacteria bacterium RIFCSPHIGHO2_02_FULL_49_10]OGD71373.1 MAG: hypothetical protein A2703_03595 [Candidatus Collierbacteria bacterium RIFCSPHIGHO2_01_FULL_50_25]OGD74040.1 MAG: hypothetical protein A3A84_01050 [Candidatus Collierbacteria bacterium RIFCSPLOWO2_01_FULL_50_23]
MTKYKKYFQEMRGANQEAFKQFRKIHDLFATDRVRYQDDFNREGQKIMEIIQEWEKRLCSRMEGGKNSVYSANLSEKFRNEIRSEFPKIDLVGVRLTFAA